MALLNSIWPVCHRGEVTASHAAVDVACATSPLLQDRRIWMTKDSSQCDFHPDLATTRSHRSTAQWALSSLLTGPCCRPPAASPRLDCLACSLDRVASRCQTHRRDCSAASTGAPGCGTPVGHCYRQKLTWSIWAKKRAAIKMGFEDNHNWVVNWPLRGYVWAGLGHVSL
jgi:hypothetical protein